MKQKVIAMKVVPGFVRVDGIEIQIKLPPGCEGIMMVFESKKSARAWWGNDIALLEVEEIK